MQTYVRPKPKDGDPKPAFSLSSKQAASLPQLASAAEASPMVQLQTMMNNSSGAIQFRKFQHMADHRPRAQEMAQRQQGLNLSARNPAAGRATQRECGEEMDDGLGAGYLLAGTLPVQLQCRACEEELSGQGTGIEDRSVRQGKLASSAQSVQLRAGRGAGGNRSGLPEKLKTGIESLSGIDMSGVRVHTNSSKPAQLNALAYAQGSDIHLGPGQERHLPHEAWHIVQQAQGRVKPTMQLKDGISINAEKALEREADVMGEKATQMPQPETKILDQPTGSVSERVSKPSSNNTAPLNLRWHYPAKLVTLRTAPAGLVVSPGIQRMASNVVQAVTSHTSAEVAAAARRRERRQHGGAIVLDHQNVRTLDRNELYLWAVRDDGTGNWEFVVARQGRDWLGHPSLLYVGKPGQGQFREVLTAGVMRYSHVWGWILDNESGRFGRAPARTGAQRGTETGQNVQLAMQVFQNRTGQTATADILSANALFRNLQLGRRQFRNWGADYLRLPSLRTTLGLGAAAATLIGSTYLYRSSNVNPA